MGNRFGLRLLFAVLMLGLAVGAGIYGYNIGVAHGIAQSAALAERGAAAPGTAPIIFYPRPWGFGWGFFPFAPLFFILFWLFLVRALFWRGRWGRGYGYGYGCGYGGGVPPAFDEWHRRAHAQGPRDATAPPQSA
ncbi:MAG TPA: hypothetical protein VKD69_01005 [Vicinamibacterales bacterium]|nr:hypothetical protein [Vicinamibacterales bacterium]